MPNDHGADHAIRPAPIPASGTSPPQVRSVSAITLSQAIKRNGKAPRDGLRRPLDSQRLEGALASLLPRYDAASTRRELGRRPGR
jgi:hypothetical protein